MKRFYALLIVALFAFAPALSAQSASFYNATRDAEKMIKKMPTHNYRRAYVGINDAHINWKEFDHECELIYPVKTGFTLGYLESRHIYDGLPLFVEYGANVQYLFGKEVLSSDSMFNGSGEEITFKANMCAVNIPVNASFRLLFEDYKFVRIISATDSSATARGKLHIRYERPTANEILSVKKLVEQNLGKPACGNILYHLDTLQLKHYTDDEISQFFSR
jgi:hypothetical protein